MVEGGGRRWDGRERGTVQTVFEDGFDTFIGARTESEGTAAGGFQPFSTIAFPQPHDAQTRPEALLGMRTRGENRFHHLRGGRTTVGRPSDQALRGPFHVMAVSRRHVRGDRTVASFEVGAEVARHAGALVEEFHHPGTHTHLELVLDERIGHRIVVAVDFHVIINVDAGTFPLGVFIGLSRQGLQGGAVECRKEALSGARKFLKRVSIEGRQELADSGVDLDECEEGVMPQPGHNPALHHLHPDFDLGLVPGLGSPGRDHGDPIMVREIGIRPIEFGLIAVGTGHRGLEIVWDDGSIRSF
jgi:hypothetical protein